MSSGIFTPNDDVYIDVGGQLISGWQRVRITRGIERMPSDFEIELTEYYTGDNSTVVIEPGSYCQVYLGTDLVLTGYVDAYEPRITGDTHSVSIYGRSMSEDLVDCSAEYPNAQIMSSTVLQIVQALATTPYGIKVSQNSFPDSERNTIPQTNFIYGETAVEVIERICRYAKLLFYDQPDGSILLTTASSKKAASGFVQGINVQEAFAHVTMTRFRDYTCVYSSTVQFSDGLQLNSGQNNSVNFLWNEHDSTVKRNRKKYIVLESGDTDPFTITKARALWELNRRLGKAWEVRVVTDTWRDSAGDLWEPNTLVDLQLPALKIVDETWLISEVTFSRDERGTLATLIINPAQAFVPEPIVLIPSLFPDRFLANQTGNKTPTPPTGRGENVAFPAGLDQTQLVEPTLDQATNGVKGAIPK
jgi:prophage tail gpP-like protein